VRSAIPEPILVTGALGFIGAALMSKLRGSGLQPIGVSRRATTSADMRVCDLEKADAVEQLFQQERPATVFHLASRVTGARDLAAVLATFTGTLSTTVHVLTAASAVAAKRVILAGSMEDLPLDAAPRYPYAAAKRAANEYAAFFGSRFGLSVSTARLGMVYGPGQRSIERLVPHVILTQLAGQRPRLSTGRRRVDWIFVEDVLDGLLALAVGGAGGADGKVVDALRGKVVDIGTGRLSSVAEVAELIRACTAGPAAELGAVPERSQDPDLALDAQETRRLLGWHSQIDLEEGLRRTVEWYRAARAQGEL
jgi:UDP-glucose 4-epimerase